nr:HutD family protein [Aquabacterium terrae]
MQVDRVAPQPWRNGRGATRELLAWPDAADWQLRISVADITQDGPFSSFPDIERWFAVLEGDGVVLQFADRRVALDVHSAPLPFDGAAAPQCSLQGGATRDLNLMLRRSAGKGLMQRVQSDEEWFSIAAMRAVFTTGGARLQIDDADAAVLPPWTLAWSPQASRQRWRLRSDAAPHAFWLALDRHC